MSVVEQLTDEERAQVELIGTNRERRYARLLYTHAADRAALVAQLEAEQRHSRDTAGAYAEKSEALILAEAQVAELTRERDSWRRTAETLTRERDEARASAQQLRELWDGTRWSRDKAQREVTRLTEALAAAERRSVFNAGKCGEEYARAEAAESSLAAANALLEEIEEGCDDISDWKRRYRAHLAAQEKKS